MAYLAYAGEPAGDGRVLGTRPCVCGLVAEEYGGDTIMVPVSAKQRTGIDDLLENILLVAEVDSRMWPRVLIAISAVALVVGTALLLSYLTFLSEARNNVIGALSLVGDLPLIIVVHAVVGGVGICLQTAGLSLKVSRARAIVFSLVGWLLVIAASLIVRFPFYDAYLSVGF